MDPPPHDAGRAVAGAGAPPPSPTTARTVDAVRPDVALDRALPAARRAPRRPQRRRVVHRQPGPRARRDRGSASPSSHPSWTAILRDSTTTVRRGAPGVPLSVRRALPERAAGAASSVGADVVHLQFELFLYGGPPSLRRAARRRSARATRARRRPARDDDAPGRRPGDRRPRLHPAAPRRRARPSSPARASPPCSRRSPGERGDDRPRGRRSAGSLPRRHGHPPRHRGRRAPWTAREARRALGLERSLRRAVLRVPRPVQGHRARARGRRASPGPASTSSSPAASIPRLRAAGRASAPSCAARYGDVARFTGLGARRRRRRVVHRRRPGRVPVPQAVLVERRAGPRPRPRHAACCCRRRSPAAPARRASSTAPIDAGRACRAGSRSWPPTPPASTSSGTGRRARRGPALAGRRRAPRPPVRGGARCRTCCSSAPSGRVTLATKRSARRSARVLARRPRGRRRSAATPPTTRAPPRRARPIGDSRRARCSARASRRRPRASAAARVFKSLHPSTGRPRRHALLRNAVRWSAAAKCRPARTVALLGVGAGDLRGRRRAGDRPLARRATSTCSSCATRSRRPCSPTPARPTPFWIGADRPGSAGAPWPTSSRSRRPGGRSTVALSHLAGDSAALVEQPGGRRSRRSAGTHSVHAATVAGRATARRASRPSSCASSSAPTSRCSIAPADLVDGGGDVRRRPTSWSGCASTPSSPPGWPARRFVAVAHEPKLAGLARRLGQVVRAARTPRAECCAGAVEPRPRPARRRPPSPSPARSPAAQRTLELLRLLLTAVCPTSRARRRPAAVGRERRVVTRHRRPPSPSQPSARGRTARRPSAADRPGRAARRRARQPAVRRRHGPRAARPAEYARWSSRSSPCSCCSHVPAAAAQRRRRAGTRAARPAAPPRSPSPARRRG